MAEPAGKPGSVVDSHSSRRIVADTLERPTRIRRGPRHWIPIWPCSRWGLPCRPVARLAVRSYRTISPLPRVLPPAFRRSGGTWPDFRPTSAPASGPFGGVFLLHFPSARAAQALPGTVPCGARTFLGTNGKLVTRLSGRLRRAQCTAPRLNRRGRVDGGGCGGSRAWRPGLEASPGRLPALASIALEQAGRASGGCCDAARGTGPEPAVTGPAAPNSESQNMRLNSS